MRVALTTTFSPWDARAGIAQFGTRDLADALHRRGVDVSVVYTMEGHEEPRTDLPPPYPVRWASVLRAVRRRGATSMSEHAAPAAWALRELDEEGRIDLVHGQGEEMALVADALPQARRVVSAHPVARSSQPRGKPSAEPGPCIASTRLALEQAHAIVVSGARDLRASMAAPLVDWERLIAVERGLSRRFFAAEGLFAAGAPTHLLVVGGNGEDLPSRRLFAGLRWLPEDAYLPVCWLGDLGSSRRSRPPAHLQLPRGVECIGMADERSLQRLVGRAAEVIILDDCDRSSELLRIAIAMGKRISTCEQALRTLVSDLEPLALPGLPEDEAGFAELLRVASGAAGLRAPEAGQRIEFARQHFSWDAVAARHIELYERLCRSGEETASAVPESD
jgi:hypothetical protein